MADLKKLGELVNRLNVLSLGGKIGWQETSDEQAFQANFPKYTVTVSKVDDPEGQSDSIGIAVRDIGGRTLEQGWEYQFSSVYNPDEKSLSRVLRQLHESARRKALNVDKALDDLLGSLADTQD